MNSFKVIGMISELEPQWDTRKSFYKKAFVRYDGDGVYSLFSYQTLVCKIDNNTILLNGFSFYSNTTTRHLKDFLYQYLDTTSASYNYLYTHNFTKKAIETIAQY